MKLFKKQSTINSTTITELTKTLGRTLNIIKKNRAQIILLTEALNKTINNQNVLIRNSGLEYTKPIKRDKMN